MSPEEIGMLLAICASYDRRTVGEADVIAWFRVLGDLDYPECESAVIAHYADSREWIMAADVRTRVKRSRRATADRERIGELLDPATYRREIESADRRTLALIQARAGRTLAITGPSPAVSYLPPQPRRVIDHPREVALRQVAESRAARGAEPEETAS